MLKCAETHINKNHFKTFLTIKMCVFKESHWEEVQFDGYVGSKTNQSDSALIISKNLRYPKYS